MTRRFCTPILAAAVLLGCGPAMLSAARTKIQVRPPETEPLVAHALIEQAHWTANWQLNLPVKTDEVIDRLFVYGPHLYALTDTNILFCMDRQNGRTLYAVTLCPRELPLCSPVFYQGRLGFIAGNQFHVFDPSTGTVHAAESLKQVGNIFSCAFSRNNDYLYVAGSDNRLHVISPDGFWELFSASADNDSPINSVKATNAIVIFATAAGNVVGMNPVQAEKYWQFDITGPIQAPLVVDDAYVYAAGMDAKLYKLNKQSGRMAWDQPFHAGAPLRDAVTLGTTAIYLYNDLNGLYAVDKQTGQAAWHLASGREVICEAGTRAFAFARPGVLKVMDNATARELYSVNFSRVQRYAINTEDAVMYLADTAGRVMSVSVQ